MEIIEDALKLLRTKTEGCLIPHKRTGRIYEIVDKKYAVVPSREKSIVIHYSSSDIDKNTPPIMRIEEKSDGELHIFIPWVVPENVSPKEHLKSVQLLLEKLSPLLRRETKKDDGGK